MTYGEGRGELGLVKQFFLEVPQRPEGQHPVPDVVNGEVREARGLGVHQPFAAV